MWYLTVKEQIESNGIVKCPYDDAFFSNNDKELQGLMTIHVDDFIYAGSEHFEDIIVNNVLHNVDVKTMDATDFTYLGLEIKQLEDKSITVSQNKYIQRELHEIPISLKRKVRKITLCRLLSISNTDLFVGNCYGYQFKRGQIFRLIHYVTKPIE